MKEIAMSDSNEISSFPVDPGTKVSFCNRTGKSLELSIEASDQTKVRFIILAGQRAEITAGTASPTIILNDVSGDLIGVPSDNEDDSAP
jgi:hypothetical protein